MPAPGDCVLRAANTVMVPLRGHMGILTEVPLGKAAVPARRGGKHPPTGGRQTGPLDSRGRYVVFQHSHLPPPDRLTQGEVWNGPVPGLSDQEEDYEMSGIGAVGAHMSTTLLYWKRNELIRQASLNLHGETPCGGVGG